MTIQTKNCICGAPFEFEMVVNPFTGNSIPNQSHCDECIREHDQPSIRGKKKIKLSRFEGYEDFDFEKLPAKSRGAAEAVAEWRLSEKGILLIGPAGVGKTYIIFELGRRLESTGVRVAVIHDHEINALTRTNDNRRESILSEVSNCQVICWDDFGSAKMSDAIESFYFDLLERSYKAGKPILATANFSGEQIKEKWAATMEEESFLEDRGEKLVRRLREQCKAIKIN